MCGDHIINIFNGEFGIIEKLYGFDRIQINATIENGVDIKKFRREDIIKNLLICILFNLIYYNILNYINMYRISKKGYFYLNKKRIGINEIKKKLIQ